MNDLPGTLRVWLNESGYITMWDKHIHKCDSHVIMRGPNESHGAECEFEPNESVSDL
jgi:hypothetical protein